MNKYRRAAMIAEGSRIIGVSRIKGHKEGAVSAWLWDAAGHAKKKGHPETDENGQFFRSTMLDDYSRICRVIRTYRKWCPCLTSLQ